MTQLALNFDPTAARAARDQAIQQVAANANTDHRAACERALTTVIERGEPFTTDDVIRELGAVMLAASRGKRIAATGRFVSSARVENHGRTVREWRKA